MTLSFGCTSEPRWNVGPLQTNGRGRLSDPWCQAELEKVVWVPRQLPVVADGACGSITDRCVCGVGTHVRLPAPSAEGIEGRHPSHRERTQLPDLGF